MDIDRPRRTSSTPTTTSELFICFTSRLSHSSSMRLSSKSILSPGRSAADKSAAHSLSSSLSRRLRHNGSLRGGQSPAMFPSKKSRGGSGFDNPEPSSPKVTCIGQVRVKTKKQGKKMKMRACRSRRLSAGEASFRRIEHGNEGLMHQKSQGVGVGVGVQNQHQQADCGLNHRNQRWVHLPLTICEALRSFGAEFSCLLPCKSSCFSSCNGGEERDRIRERSSSGGGSCGAVFRWLVAVQEGEGEVRERDIELVVGEEDTELERDGRERMMMGLECSSRRRSIFDDMEFKDEVFDVKQEDEEARFSVCIPPKNALLLMRCRSDPAKMSTVSHKIWEAPPAQDDEDDEEEEVPVEEEKREVEGVALEAMEEKTEEVVDEKGEKFTELVEEMEEICEDWLVVDANVEKHEVGSEDLAILDEENTQIENRDEEKEETKSTENKEKTEQRHCFSGEEDENLPGRFSIDAITIRKMFEEGGVELNFVKKTEVTEKEIANISDISSFFSSSSSSEESTRETQQEQERKEHSDEELVKSMEKKDEKEEEQQPPLEGQPELNHHERSETAYQENENNTKMLEEEEQEEREREMKKPAVLPDCLLLMMCEPKLSMEVSKETWVCSTDFIRWLPERHHSKKTTKMEGPDEPKKKKSAPMKMFPVQPPVQAAVQPARSSISFPASGIGQKVGKAGGGFEPFVLTRCKSAPMRSTAKIAAPASELACKPGREMEPHRPATYGIGAAGVGF